MEVGKIKEDKFFIRNGEFATDIEVANSLDITYVEYRDIL